jgi:two-component system chemotaxis response regulator CheY
VSQPDVQSTTVPAAASTVLLVEDDHAVRVSVRSILEEEGYKVVSVTNGRSALEVLEAAAAPKLILLDLVLPVMDGWEFMARIQDEPRWASIPVVILSARRERPPTRVVDFLAKPLGREALLRVVAEHCGPGYKHSVVKPGELPPLVGDDDDDDVA